MLASVATHLRAAAARPLKSPGAGGRRRSGVCRGAGSGNRPRWGCDPAGIGGTWGQVSGGVAVLNPRLQAEIPPGFWDGRERNLVGDSTGRGWWWTVWTKWTAWTLGALQVQGIGARGGPLEGSGGERCAPPPRRGGAPIGEPRRGPGQGERDFAEGAGSGSRPRWGCDPAGIGGTGGRFPGVSRCSTPGYRLKSLRDFGTGVSATSYATLPGGGGGGRYGLDGRWGQGELRAVARPL